MCIDICAWIWATSFVITELACIQHAQNVFSKINTQLLFFCQRWFDSTSVTAPFVSKQAKIPGIAGPVKGLVFHWAPVKT